MRILANRLLFFGVMMSVVSHLFGQQEIQTSQFMVNPFLLNPAYSSMDDNIDAKMSYRNQWIGVEGAPVTSYFSIHSPLGKPRWAQTHPGDAHNWHGAGLQVINDRIGPFNDYRFNANYSYNLGLTKGDGYGYQHTDGLRVALGAFLTMNNRTLNNDLLSQSKTSTGSRIDNEAVIDDVVYNELNFLSGETFFDANFGALFYYGEKYYLGIASTQLFERELFLREQSKLSRHYFITAKTKHQLNEAFYLIPSVILQYVNNAPSTYNFNVRLDWQDKLFGGLAYRSDDSMIMMLGAEVQWGEKIKNFRIDKHRYRMHFYYSYDFTVNKLNTKRLNGRSVGSHEITIAFLLPPFYVERNAEDTWDWMKR